MCIVFRVVGSFLILDCHQSIGYPMERVHGWPWIPWCNTIRKVPMHGGCWLGAPWKWTDCSGFWVWIQQREFVLSAFSDEASVFFFEWKNLMIFLGNGMIGATNWLSDSCELNPTTQWKINFWSGQVPGALAADAFQHGNWGKYQYTFMNSALRHFWAAFFVLEHEHVS